MEKPHNLMSNISELLNNGLEEVNVEKCLDILRSVRPTVRPNPGFMLELMSLQRFLNTRLSLTIQDSAVTTTHSSDGNLP